MVGIGAILAQGAALGFAIAAPVGPIGLLCIRRTLVQGAGVGLASGVGAAAADACYGLLTALGLGTLASLLVAHTALLRIGGGLLLAVLGLMALRHAVVATGTTNQTGGGRPATGLFLAFGSTFVLTLANPATILSFAGAVAALASPGDTAAGSLETTTGNGLALVAGVFAGSVAWWLILVSGVSVARHALSATAIRVIEAIAGAAFLGLGAYAIRAGL
ncbi:MAG: LysE family transporter [Azospirillaceae bacterium]|nr:LysE family transporter [Azospirillaceae bacterium]